MKRAIIIVKGQVQRVGYREAVMEIAKKLNLAGFVENLKPWGIRIVAEGEDSKMERFIEEIKIKRYPIDVEHLEVQFDDFTAEFEYFEIKRENWQEELVERLDAATMLLYRIMVSGENLRNVLDGEIREQISTLQQETMKFNEDLKNMRGELGGEIREQISTLRQERLILFEKEMLSDMHEHFKRYDSALQKTLGRFPYEKSVFIMMPFEENDIRLKQITDTIKKTLEEHGLSGWRADDPARVIMDDIWDNIVVNMLSCKYGIAVFVDRRVLDRYTDREITVFNANIALEVGFMKSRGFEVLLLKDKRLEKLPTDIISKLYEEFNFNDPEGGVKKAVTKWIEKMTLW
jgi:acylphosphatase